MSHPRHLTSLLQPNVIKFVEMDTVWWLIVTPMAQMHCQAVCIGSLAVSSTEDVVALCWATSPTDEADAFMRVFDDALTHIHTPM